MCLKHVSLWEAKGGILVFKHGIWYQKTCIFVPQNTSPLEVWDFPHPKKLMWDFGKKKLRILSVGFGNFDTPYYKKII